jgi:hypothetical protein
MEATGEAQLRLGGIKMLGIPAKRGAVRHDFQAI